ncbi:iron complex outermembrane receptor protein [Sphingomonas sp. PP-CE-3G-477]|uniref:TonB-dependent receptor n=1 Tax=Sphingomonas sp. PP-CE-3G-477 TaxID=2135660 RepID=UPI000D372E3C|nr:TonB-dependent receptor [Sphingomonas sp. PP-CE-3G-477]PTQ63095.1 iron complex outermembrane receptor protein [Sphingomonas sp. PP-CE-3G-477]
MRGHDFARLTAVLLATTCLPMMADAQTSAANPEQTRTEGTTAQPSADPDTSMEVIVTARRRAENAQKIPGSLSVVGGALLDRSYTVNTQQLSQLVPALNYSSANPRNTAFTIRGLGSSVVAVSQANDGLEPGVGYYVDQVYHARPATAAFDFSDIEQVEVLRGPQGTLFGKNSTAGAINITTRAPTFTTQGEAEISYASYNFLQVKGAVSGPIIGDTLAGRVSVVSTRRDGVIDNVVTARDQNTIGNQAIRGQLLFRPSEVFQVKVSADFTNFQSNCCTQVYYNVATRPGSGTDGRLFRTATRQFGGPTGLAAQFNYAPPSTNPYDRKTDIDAALGVDTNEGGVGVIADWNLGGATLTSVSAWRFWNWDADNDRDYTGIPIQTEQHIPSRQDQYSQELRLASNGDHKVSYVGGLYFFRQRVIGRPISIYGPAAARYLIGTSTGTGAAATAVPSNLLDGYGTDGRTDFRSDSYAAFGEVNWKPVDRLTLTGGLRYTYEEKEGTYDTFTFGGLQTTNAALNTAKLSILRGQNYAASDKDGALTGRANIAYQATDGILAYASYARGEKSGGINMSGLPLNDQNQPAIGTAVVRPEKNTAYEIGLKTQLFDNRLIFNVDGYYTRVTDFQANVTDTRAAAALRTYLANIPKVTVRGFEADATALVTHNLSLRGSVAYADGKFNSYPAAPCPIERIFNTAAFCDLSGQRLSSLPRWSYTLGADYNQPIADIGSGFVHVDSNTRTRQFGDPSGSAFTVIEGYTIVNGSIGFRSKDGWELAVFSRNLLNKDYIQNVTIQAGNSGLILATPSDPRTIGLTFRIKQ